MNILCVTNLFPDRSRPEFAPFNRQQLIYLSAIHNVHVISPVPWPHRLKLALKGERPIPLEECSGMGVDYPIFYYTPKVMRDMYWRFYYNSIKLVFSRAVHRFKPDIIYATWAYPDSRAAVELAAEHGLPVVCRIHGSDINDYIRFPGRKHLILEAMSKADGIISVNEDLAGRLRYEDIEPGKIHVVYNGIDRSIFMPVDRSECREELGLDREMKMILFAGNLKQVKGIDVLLEALEKIEMRDWQLHILGRGPEKVHLEKMASRPPLSGKVFFHGSVPHNDMVKWFNASDVFCLPSLHEGTPNVILESLACSIPVVCSDTGGIPEIVTGDSGILFEVGNSRTLSESLVKALTREWDRSSIDCPAETWTKNAQRVTDVFDITIRSFKRNASGTHHAHSS
ncbi:MAG: glycosyltransferase family 4 protein [Bacteroidales bacterium]|nr:glycosyltransferase family 4 protein [Candidatus Latescibacterota bacterium]